MGSQANQRWRSVATLYMGFCLLLGFFPHYGPPHFRYTGSDPANEVWNIGWPLATMIWDDQCGLEIGPFAYIVLPLLIGIGMTGAAVVVRVRSVRNSQRLPLTGDARE